MPIGPAVPVNYLHLVITAAITFAVAIVLVAIVIGIHHCIKRNAHGWTSGPSEPGSPTSERPPAATDPEQPSSSSTLPEVEGAQEWTGSIPLAETSSTSSPKELKDNSESQLVAPQSVLLCCDFEPNLTTIICDTSTILLIGQAIAILHVELWVALQIEKRAFSNLHKFGMYLAKIQTQALLESETGKKLRFKLNCTKAIIVKIDDKPSMTCSLLNHTIYGKTAIRRDIE